MFDDVPLEDVLGWFKRQGLERFVLRWKVLERTATISRDKSVTLQLENVPLGEVLSLVLEQASADELLPEDQLTFHVN